jgi:internalin A
MKYLISFVAVAVLALLSACQPRVPVVLSDPGLEAAVRSAIDRSTGEIYERDLLSIETLEAPSMNISDLSGLAHCANLVVLRVDDNAITDLTPLADLTSLTILEAKGNSIQDLNPISSLTQLTELLLGQHGEGNLIDDISMLGGLVNLTILRLGDNQLGSSDLSVLSALTKLTELNLQGNGMTDIAFLSDLTNLEVLWLHWGDTGNNSITDIGVIADLTKLTHLDLSGNSNLTDITPLASLVQLDHLSIPACGISDLATLLTIHNGGGFQSGSYINMTDNGLNLSPGSANRDIVDTLVSAGVEIVYASGNNL